MTVQSSHTPNTLSLADDVLYDCETIVIIDQSTLTRYY